MPPSCSTTPEEQDPAYLRPQPEQRETFAPPNPHEVGPRSSHVYRDQRQSIPTVDPVVRGVESTAVEEVFSLSGSRRASQDSEFVKRQSQQAPQDHGEIGKQLKISLRKLACRIPSTKAAFEIVKGIINKLIIDTYYREDLLRDLQGIRTVRHQSTLILRFGTYY